LPKISIITIMANVPVTCISKITYAFLAPYSPFSRGNKASRGTSVDEVTYFFQVLPGYVSLFRKGANSFLTFHKVKDLVKARKRSNKVQSMTLIRKQQGVKISKKVFPYASC
jgi:hypothetical protein